MKRNVILIVGKNLGVTQCRSLHSNEMLHLRSAWQCPTRWNTASHCLLERHSVMIRMLRCI